MPLPKITKNIEEVTFVKSFVNIRYILHSHCFTVLMINLVFSRICFCDIIYSCENVKLCDNSFKDELSQSYSLVSS